MATLLFPYSAKSQQWQHTLTADSRFGYTSNTYLNPFMGEWDRSGKSAYGLFSLLGNSLWSQSVHSLNLTGGAVYEPFFSDRESWAGAFGMAAYSVEYSNSITGSIQAGTAYYTSSFNRSTVWIQPSVTWFVSPFTLLRVKAGSSFINYTNYFGTGYSRRFDLYAVEMETWPSYRLQVTSGLYGGLDTIPSIYNGFNGNISASYSFSNGFRAHTRVGLEQYRTTIAGTFEVPTGTAESSMGRILRFGIGGSYPLNESLSLFGNMDYLRFSNRGDASEDLHLSAGVRISMKPGAGEESRRANPDWQKEDEYYQLRVQYRGEGQLYLVGDFNNWSRPGIPLAGASDGIYRARLELATGAYSYKILLVREDTEEWLEFSNDTYTVMDGFGDRNALLLVE